MINMILGLICLSILVWYLPPVARWRENHAQARWDATHPAPPPIRPLAIDIPKTVTHTVSNALGQSFIVRYTDPRAATPTTLIEVQDLQGQRRGYARLGWLRPDRVVLAMIDINEDYRGQKLGTEVLAIIIRLAREQGVQTIEGAIPWERRAWYERNGFAPHPQRGMLYDLTGGSILYPKTGEPWTEEEERLIHIWTPMTTHSLIYYAASLQRHPDEFIQHLHELGITLPRQYT